MAVIVSTVRTPIGRAYRGGFNAEAAPALAAHAIREAVSRDKLEPGEIEDCIIGCALPQGTRHVIGRSAALRAGLPPDVSAMSIDRHCGSGLIVIATSAKQVIVDRINVVQAGGVESISLVQNDQLRINEDPRLLDVCPEFYMPKGRSGDS